MVVFRLKTGRKVTKVPFLVLLLYIKKLRNGEIYRAAVDHHDIIKEQIDLYKADFIICCGTEYAFMDACYKDREVDWKMTSRGIWYFRDGKSVVISFSHPEARVKDAYLFYALTDAVKEIMRCEEFEERL